MAVSGCEELLFNYKNWILIVKKGFWKKWNSRLWVFFGKMKGKRGKIKWMKVEMKFSHHYTLTTTLSSYNRTEKADWFLGEWWPKFENIWKNFSANTL